ncbi:uncharacterized protein AB675_6195 [Cyphellophora attinorum]|uniref:BZIP domain-containing protein n=1 Tax=Cyphellophora attinorum TaxID=1664694 RepID=A0A0N1HFR8_9EURO|nr:uncharacterized protein AB675_6195 [Phialophora attinorum]KPI44162.1 hypothetical protein AB675_6195 [Phialophora attinorum]
MSDFGPEYSKADKKREYNRNAQRVFRQRRKEHLSKLEQAHREKQDMQSDEMQRLRRENQALQAENESLKAAYASQGNSPAPSLSPIDTRLNAHLPYGEPQMSLEAVSATTPAAMTPVIPTMMQDHSSIVVVQPNNIHEIRRYLHQVFAPLLDMSVIHNPQAHLATLQALRPSLPSSLKPSQLQLTTTHNVYIDMIPSPHLRDQLIRVGPARASSFLMEACTLVCQIEDVGQMTIWGEDWLNEFSWEFSPAVLERFGPWLLGREWGQRANYWRKQRGAPRLPGYD